MDDVKETLTWRYPDSTQINNAFNEVMKQVKELEMAQMTTLLEKAIVESK